MRPLVDIEHDAGTRLPFRDAFLMGMSAAYVSVMLRRFQE